jgi:hypothetical protein
MSEESTCYDSDAFMVELSLQDVPDDDISLLQMYDLLEDSDEFLELHLVECSTECDAVQSNLSLTNGMFPENLADYILEHGALTMLYTNNACAEPHYQNQKLPEHKIQDIKKDREAIMNITNTAAAYWPL